MGEKSQKIQLMVVDEHKGIREGFVSYFEREPDITIVGTAENGQQAIEMALKFKPDVILMNINLPIINGIEATRQIVSKLSGILIIGTSIDDDRVTIESVLSAGASAFVPKYVNSEEILKIIRKYFYSN